MRPGVLLFALVVPWTAAHGSESPDTIKLPDFPLPDFAKDRSGFPEQVGVIRLLRELQRGGVHGSDHFETVDTNYSVITSASLGLLCAWLESACKSVGLDLATARSGPYDGRIYARLLAVATSIAAARVATAPTAVPVGVLICRRTKPWGSLPGDGQPDAYVLIGTELGFLVYDPPTRQFANLADHPNNFTVTKVRL